MPEVKPIPPAPERCRMSVVNSELILNAGTPDATTIALVHNEDMARRLAACWNKFIPMPTSLIETMPGSVAEMALMLRARA